MDTLVICPLHCCRTHADTTILHKLTARAQQQQQQQLDVTPTTTHIHTYTCAHAHAMSCSTLPRIMPCFADPLLLNPLPPPPPSRCLPACLSVTITTTIHSPPLLYPAAVAAERESLLDEISRLVDQAGTSTELLNELILNKSEVRRSRKGAAGRRCRGLCVVM